MAENPAKKIAFVLPENTTSGGALIVRHHAEHLHSRGYEVHVLFECLAEDSLSMWGASSVKTGLLSDFVSRGGRVELAVGTYWSTCFSLTSILSDHKAYFVQSDERRFFPEADRAMTGAVADTYSWRDHFYYVTEARWIQRMLKEEFDTKASYAPNGIDLTLFEPGGPALSARKKGRFRILIEGAGSLPYKKVAEAFQVTNELRKKYTRIEVWHVASDGFIDPSWKSERTFSRVPVEKMPEIYRSCDLLLKLSSVEGFFGPPLEMMACGGVCVVSDVTGHEEYIVDNENALVARGGDVVQAASAVAALIEDSELLERLREAGLRTASEFSWENKQDAFVDFVEQALRQEPKAPFPLLSGVGSAVSLAEHLQYKTGLKTRVIQILKELGSRMRVLLTKFLKPKQEVQIESLVSSLDEPTETPIGKPIAQPERPLQKILFVGQEEYFRSCWFDALSTGHEAMAVRSGGVGFERLEEEVHAKNIDAVVVFRPEWLRESASQMQNLRHNGVRFWGFSTEPLPQRSWARLGHQDQIRRWNSLKGAFSLPFESIFHFDQSSRGFLEQNAPEVSWKFMPLPVSQKLFFPEKHELKFDACFLGRSTPYREHFLAKVKERFDVVHVAHGLRDEQARSLMCQSKVVINLHNENYPNFENRVAQALLCGREVLSQPLSGEGGSLPGVSFFETPGELVELVARKSRMPEELGASTVDFLADKFSVRKLIDAVIAF